MHHFRNFPQQIQYFKILQNRSSYQTRIAGFNIPRLPKCRNSSCTRRVEEVYCPEYKRRCLLYDIPTAKPVVFSFAKIINQRSILAVFRTIVFRENSNCFVLAVIFAEFGVDMRERNSKSFPHKNHFINQKKISS